MKKKVVALLGTCLLLSIGLLAFGASSTANSHSIVPVNVSVEQASSSNSETPQAIWGAVAKAGQKAWVYGTHAYKANAAALRDATTQGSIMLGGYNNSDVQDEAVEEIFDK